MFQNRVCGSGHQAFTKNSLYVSHSLIKMNDINQSFHYRRGNMDKFILGDILRHIYTLSALVLQFKNKNKNKKQGFKRLTKNTVVPGRRKKVQLYF